jgi:hypothetical protein
LRPPGALNHALSRLARISDAPMPQRAFYLREEGFETSGVGFKTEIDWTAVAEIAERGATIFFLTEWRENFFVPKRAFASLDDAAQFAQRARDLWAARHDEVTAAAESPPERYELTYRLERADVAAFLRLRREITGWRKLLIFLPAFVLGGVYGLLRDSSPIAALVDSLGVWVILVVIALVAVWYVLVAIVMALVRAARVRRTVLPAGDTRLVADKAGVTVSADRGERRYSWREVPAVVLGAMHVFLLTAPRKAVIIPGRAFTGRAAMVRFSNFAEEASKHAEA